MRGVEALVRGVETLVRGVETLVRGVEALVSWAPAAEALVTPPRRCLPEAYGAGPPTPPHPGSAPLSPPPPQLQVGGQGRRKRRGLCPLSQLSAPRQPAGGQVEALGQEVVLLISSLAGNDP